MNIKSMHSSSFIKTLILCLLLTSYTYTAAEDKPASKDTFNWDSFDILLKSNISYSSAKSIHSNLVDYKQLSSSKSFTLIASNLKNYDPEHLTHKQKLAFYINAYNYFTLKLIIDRNPKNSIRDLNSIFTSIWSKNTANIGGKALSLDDIEHKIIRPMGEARSHFALVCASLSCPDLRDEVYKAEALDEQLDDQVMRFITNPTKGTTTKNDTLFVSKVFEWYEEDFEPDGGVLLFLQKYRPDYKKYDHYSTFYYNWMLNAL